MSSYDYDAFLSYRRRDATRLAQWIRRRLQRFRIPPEILKELSSERRGIHERTPRIWLDTSYEKASDDFLVKKIFPALDSSARLIVILTPAALEQLYGRDGEAIENWLVREVDHFLGSAADQASRPIDVVFGPGATEDKYPGRLSEKPRWDWIDFRSFSNWRLRTFTGELDDGLIKLVAALYDVPDRFLPILRREERRERNRRNVVSALGTLTILALMTALAIWGLIQRENAAGALANRARLSTSLSAEELQRKDPDRALAIALAGVETPDISKTDRPIIVESITAVANSMANQAFAGTLREHTDAVKTTSLNADGTSAISVGADGKAIFWIGRNGQPLRPAKSTTLAGGVFAIASATFAVASGSPSGQIQLWRPESSDASSKPIEFGESLATLTFSDDGRLIGALGTAGTIAVWSFEKNDFLWVAPSPTPSASTITFGLNCGCLVVGTSTGTLLVWYFDRKEPVILPGASGKVTQAVMDRNGTLVFVTDDNKAWITSAPSWPAPQNIAQHDRTITSVAISPEGRLAVTASMDGIVRLYDVANRIGWMRIRPGADVAVTSATFSPDGNTVVFGRGDGILSAWDVSDSTADPIETMELRGHAAAVLDAQFSADGNWIASSSIDRTVRLWRLNTARQPRVFLTHQGTAFHASSNNGRYLITGGGPDKKVELRVGPNWVPTKSILLKDEPNALAVTDDGRRAFIGTIKGDVLQWDVASTAITTISQGNGVVGSMAIAPNGSTLAAIGIGARVQVCALNIPLARCDTIPLGPREWGYNVAFSLDGRWLGATSGIEGERGSARIWDLETKTAKVLVGHTERVSQILFDRSSKRAITASWDGTARIWDLSSGREIVRLAEPKGRLSTAGFSADGEWVATCFNNQTLRLWKIPKAIGSQSKPLLLDARASVLVSDNVPIAQILFGFDSNMLAGSLQDGKINLWHVPDGTLRAVLESNGPPFQNMLFHQTGQITAMTQSGRLLNWVFMPALALTDARLLPAARSMLPLSGALVGKVDKDTGDRGDSAPRCTFLAEHNIGLPPHSLSGASRARAPLTIPAECTSALLGKRRLLAEGLAAEAQGDAVTARQKFLSTSAQGEHLAEIGLGDLSFLNGVNGSELGSAFDYYTRALQSDTPHAGSRLGWLLLAGEEIENVARARTYFEDSSKKGDADGYAGLAWIDERFGKSADDLERAFSNYIRAQDAYERDGNFRFAEDVAQRRAMLTRLMDAEKVSDLFLFSRRTLSSSKAVNAR
jgi:WD40 repeat protein